LRMGQRDNQVSGSGVLSGRSAGRAGNVLEW
jgi:hypothetical protein